MIPIVGLMRSDAVTPIAAPASAATSSRRPVMSPTARPAIAAGKMTSMPNRLGSTTASPSITPAKVARFQGMRVVTTAGYQ